MADKHRIFQVDAFTDRAFSGNPAAVCLLGEPRDPDWKHAVARELNQSSTTFVENRGDSFGIRWFTRREELAINGTGTLCSAHVLWETGLASRDQELRLESQNDVFVARWDEGWIEMSFPAGAVHSIDPPDGLIAGFGATPIEVVRGARNVIAVYENESAVRAIEADLDALGTIEARGVIATAADAGSEFDFISRYFGPSSGIGEDPVNGSSHAELGPFWGARLGRDVLLAQQASARGGLLRLRPQGERILMAGKAVTVARGELI